MLKANGQDIYQGHSTMNNISIVRREEEEGKWKVKEKGKTTYPEDRLGEGLIISLVLI